MDQFGTLGNYSSGISSDRGFGTLRDPSICPSEWTIGNCCSNCQLVVTNSVGQILVLDKGSDVVDGKAFYTVCGHSFPEEKVLHNVRFLTSNQKLFPLIPEATMKLSHCFKKIS